MKHVPIRFILTLLACSFLNFAAFAQIPKPAQSAPATPANALNTANPKTSAPVAQPGMPAAAPTAAQVGTQSVVQNRANPQTATIQNTAPQNSAAPAVKTTQTTPQNSAATAAPVKTAPVATPPVTNTAATTAVPTPPPSTDSPVESILSEDLIRALRDPFQLPSILMAHKESPKTDLETFQLKDFHLNGVITGPKKTRAMLTAPGNKVYFVRIGDKIGVRDGTVTQIMPESIKIVEYFTDEHGKRIPDAYELLMSGELVSLNKKEE